MSHHSAILAPNMDLFPVPLEAPSGPIATGGHGAPGSGRSELRRASTEHAGFTARTT